MQPRPLPDGRFSESTTNILTGCSLLQNLNTFLLSHTCLFLIGICDLLPSMNLGYSGLKCRRKQIWAAQKKQALDAPLMRTQCERRNQLGYFQKPVGLFEQSANAARL
jgi:hypothetical protein